MFYGNSFVSYGAHTNVTLGLCSQFMKDSKGTLYEVTEVAIGRSSTELTVRNLKTDVVEKYVNSTTLIPLKGYIGMTSSIPTIGLSHPIARFENGRLEEFDTSPVQYVDWLADSLLVIVTLNSVYVCQLS